MNFNRIELSNWNRKETYTQYTDNLPCTYSMTVNIDVTKFLNHTKVNGIKFFPGILYAISHVVNCHNEFRMDLDENGNVGYYDVSNPYFTVFHNETECFTNVWTEYSNELSAFILNDNKDMEQYKNDIKSSKQLAGKNIFNVSMIPWTSFTGFNLNLQKGYEYFPPIFTIGKYFEDGNKTLLPIAIQVHHAVCDGFHLARFVNELQEVVDGFSKFII